MRAIYTTIALARDLDRLPPLRRAHRHLPRRRRRRAAGIRRRLRQEYVEDCAVCCRPIRFVVTRDDDGELAVEIREI
jgi:hypothetical protein